MRPLGWATLLTLALVYAPLGWADYEAGQRAWDTGQPAEALRLWHAAAAADAGDRRAMLALGRMYAQGLGVLQDYIEAHKWFNLAASRGEAAALQARDALAEKMTPQQVATAQERAASWRPGAGRSAPEVADTPAVDTGSPPPRAIREAQELLAALGYAPGPVDGIWGEGSVQAWRGFLRDVGRQVSDTLTPEGLRVMRDIVRRGGGTMSGREEPSAPEVSPPVQVRPDALHRAAQSGDLESLKEVLATDIEVDRRDGQGWTALMHAANKGYSLLVELLLGTQADPDVQAPDGATSLFIAALHGHSEVIELLMEAGADITIRGPKGKTATEVARTKYGNLEMAQKRNVGPAVVALLRGRFRDCDVCPEMVVVPAGSFMMGPHNANWDPQGPGHRVEIVKPFAVGLYEVTRGAFARFMRESNHSMGHSCLIYEEGDVFKWGEDSSYNWRNPGFEQTDRHPVVCVNWNDAQAYAQWLSRKTGHQYRLLSESEWEYMARAGTHTRYYWGENPSDWCRHANGGDAANDQTSYRPPRAPGAASPSVIGCDDSYHGRTSPVGTYTKNGFGLYDVLGNAYEWVLDCWNENYDGAPRDGRAWVDGECDSRMKRGGSWRVLSLHAAFRSSASTKRQANDAGFRIARTLAP